MARRKTNRVADAFEQAVIEQQGRVEKAYHTLRNERRALEILLATRPHIQAAVAKKRAR